MACWASANRCRRRTYLPGLTAIPVNLAIFAFFSSLKAESNHFLKSHVHLCEGFLSCPFCCNLNCRISCRWCNCTLYQNGGCFFLSVGASFSLAFEEISFLFSRHTSVTWKPLHKKFRLACISCCFHLLQHICIMLSLRGLTVSCLRGGMGLHLRE